MDQQDKALALSVLEHLCKGGYIEGIRFGPVLQILIGSTGSAKKIIHGQVYLNLIADWQVFDTMPTEWPSTEVDIKMGPADEQLAIICGLREVTITDIEIGNQHPHLILHLSNQSVMFVYGGHDMYECWHIGVSYPKQGESWLVIALPQDRLAIWAPKDFEASNSSV